MWEDTWAHLGSLGVHLGDLGRHLGSSERPGEALGTHLGDPGV